MANRTRFCFKGTVLRDRFRKCWRKLTDLGLNKGRGWFLNFSETPLIFNWNKSSFFRLMLNHADSLCNPINFVTELPASLLNMNISDVGFLKENWGLKFPLRCRQIVIAHRQIPLGILIAQTRSCRTYANFFYLIQILRWFIIIRCKQQAALHSALFNYTPLVVGRTDKNKQLTNFKPTQTGINRNK